MLISLDHFAQTRLVGPVAAVAIGVIAADQFGIARAQAAAISLEIKPQRVIGLPVGNTQPAPHRIARLAGILAPQLCAGGNRIKRIGEIGPVRRLVDPCRRAKGAGFAGPARQRRLRARDLFGRHPAKEIIALIERTNMVEAEPAIGARPVKPRRAFAGRAKFARLVAAGRFAQAAGPLRPAMESILFNFASPCRVMG